MYKFFMSLKQKDGSSSDIYCLLVASSFLDILTPELVEGTSEFVASCQTYEGGFASASHLPTSFDNFSPLFPSRSALGEAHGGYTFCALASWVLPQPHVIHIDAHYKLEEPVTMTTSDARHRN